MTTVTTSDATTLVVTEHIAARRETVFRYFTDPERYAAWMGTTATIEPRPGGTYRVAMNPERVARGAFVEVVPPERVVFTFGWEAHPDVPPGSTRVEVTLTEEDGGTRVTLRHTALPSPTDVANHTEGWCLYLDRLATVAAGGEVGPDPNGA